MNSRGCGKGRHGICLSKVFHVDHNRMSQSLECRLLLTTTETRSAPVEVAIGPSSDFLGPYAFLPPPYVPNQGGFNSMGLMAALRS